MNLWIKTWELRHRILLWIICMSEFYLHTQLTNALSIEVTFPENFEGIIPLYFWLPDLPLRIMMLFFIFPPPPFLHFCFFTSYCPLGLEFHYDALGWFLFSCIVFHIQWAQFNSQPSGVGTFSLLLSPVCSLYRCLINRIFRIVKHISISYFFEIFVKLSQWFFF